jgi:hypothetical protein
LLRNFLTDSYLERFYPNIINDRQGRQVGYTDAIQNGFEMLMNDLSGRGLDVRLLMVPVDLNRNASTTPNIQKLTAKTLSASEVGYAWEGSNQRRFVINLTSKTSLTDDWTFTLQGSNESERPEDDSDGWEDIEAIQYGTTTLAADIIEENATYTDLHKWYRLNVAKVAGTGSVTFTASLYETIFDPLIAFMTLKWIAASWKTGSNPRWDDMYELALKEYEDKIASIKFTYDSDQDGIPTPAESGTAAGGRIGSIGISA